MNKYDVRIFKISTVEKLIIYTIITPKHRLETKKKTVKNILTESQLI